MIIIITIVGSWCQFQALWSLSSIMETNSSRPKGDRWFTTGDVKPAAETWSFRATKLVDGFGSSQIS